jgi:predicted ribosome quality control (RQC) complex YloA/Tae2 family protein
MTALSKGLLTRIRQARESMKSAEAEPDWALWGETLKGWLYALPEPEQGFWVLENVRVPVDPKLGPSQQVERLFNLARRKKRRREEAVLRLQTAEERLQKLDPGKVIEQGDWGALQNWEREAGILVGGGDTSAVETSGGSRLKVAVPAMWHGKSYVTKDGFAILVGRSRDENLELTFKIARGNDVWMHVRGRPGAHLVIPVPTGKSVPLDTLLDAAALCIYWSGGKSWGKTEVDYTFKKYVKRIKDSTEASYTHNKTLIATPDEKRLTLLLD